MSSQHHGKVIGRYAVTAELGRGSMGVVHLAHDPVMRRDVAVKTIYLPHDLSVDQRREFRDRFLQEARTAGCLSHPGIVTIYELNETDEGGLPYIAMEYVQGPTLHETLAVLGPFEADRAFAMTDTLADALQLAHAAGVVHRDIKPANILVRESDGAAKIADFGIARFNTSDAGDEGPTYGSPAYMAPERIQGLPSDARSDLFSLAVILYEMLCGVRPFGGDDPATICYAITQEAPVPITQRNPRLAPGLNRFFDRALAKDPSQRFSDAAEFRHGLQAACLEQKSFAAGVTTIQISPPPLVAPAPGEPARARWQGVSRPWLVLGPVAVALLSISFAIGWGLRGTRPPDAGIRPRPNASPPPRMVEASPLAGDLETVPEGPTFDTVSTVEAPVEPPPVSTPEKRPEPVARPAEPRPEPPPAVPVAEAKPEPLKDPGPTFIEDPALTPGPVAAVPELAQLEVLVTSSVKRGLLTLLVDGEVVYTAELSGESKRFSRLYKKALGKANQQLGSRIEVPAGSHTILAHLAVDGKERAFEQTLEVDLESGSERTLSLVAGKTFGKRLSLTLD